MSETVYQSWIKKKITVPASSILVVDEILLMQFTTLIYKLSFFSNTKTKQLNLTALKTDTDVVNQVNERSGAMDLEIDTAIDGSNSQLTVKNNEAFEVNLILLRAKL